MNLFVYCSLVISLSLSLSLSIDAFVKNFNSEKLNLQLFKGHVALSNVELNEVVLQSLLGLPPSLVITQAVCSTVNMKVILRQRFLKRLNSFDKTIKIPWAHLKKSPVKIGIGSITIILDEPGA
jgi:hypothetical protein